ncbi:hypothetical protein [Actinopolymorpha rutila]|uniref:Uncharacterized protein n=1 Tax=Actinopolymorpha rutila TaxID=446787 RepID=A0A852ZFK5_9ACTN|nr:hypothetical protein [Actinopolymorpha rutila]NYH90668.1 hypothetical protein [Actinopolymorpha rutila]
MRDHEGCPTCGWPATDLGDPGGAGEVLSRHATSAGTVTYIRCVCGGLLVLVAGAVAGAAGSWASGQRSPGHRSTAASREAPRL